MEGGPSEASALPGREAPLASLGTLWPLLLGPLRDPAASSLHRPPVFLHAPPLHFVPGLACSNEEARNSGLQGPASALCGFSFVQSREQRGRWHGPNSPPPFNQSAILGYH